MIKQECIGIPDMILLLMIFCFKKIKIKAEIVLSPGGAYFYKPKTSKKCKRVPFDRIRKFSKKSRMVPKKTKQKRNEKNLWSRIYFWKHKKIVV